MDERQRSEVRDQRAADRLHNIRQRLSSLDETVSRIRARRTDQTDRLAALERAVPPVDQPPTFNQQPRSRRRRDRPAVPRPRGGPGTILFTRYKSWGVAGCSACNKLRRQMDQWGVAGSRARFDEIVDRILPRAQLWWKQQSPVMLATHFWSDNASLRDKLRIAATATAEGIRAALRTQVAIHVTQALDAAAAAGFT